MIWLGDRYYQVVPLLNVVTYTVTARAKNDANQPYATTTPSRDRVNNF